MININGVEYSWGNLTVFINGIMITGLRGIKYKSSREVEALYGRGVEPQALQSGNKKYEGSIKVTQTELEKLHQVALVKGKNDVTDLTGINIVVTYIPDSGVSVTKTIKGVRFTDYEEGMEQNAKFMEIDIPFQALAIINGKIV